jgi:hypothetical protein
MEIDVGRRHVSEHRIAFQFCDLERRFDSVDDCLEEVCEDVLGMLELAALEVVGIAGDIGEEEAASLGFREI